MLMKELRPELMTVVRRLTEDIDNDGSGVQKHQEYKHPRPTNVAFALHEASK
jgi:hypothetical protein